MIEIDTIGSNRNEDNVCVCPTMSESNLPAPKAILCSTHCATGTSTLLVLCDCKLSSVDSSPDRLMNSRLVLMESQRKNKPSEPSWMRQDPVLAGEYERLHRRMKTKYHAILNSEDASDGDDFRTLSQVEYEKLRADLRLRQNVLPCDVQCRI